MRVLRYQTNIMKYTVYGLILLLLLVPSVASAHAILIESSITNGAVLDTPPPNITLRFSEPLDVNHSSIELFGEDGVPFGLERVSFPAADQMSVNLPDSLRPGSYTLVYRVLSTLDGHDSVGFLLWSVATGAAPVAAPVNLAPTTNTSPFTAMVVAKAMQLLAGMAVVGGLAWLLLLLLPVLRGGDVALAFRVVRPTIWAIQVALLGLIAGTLIEFAFRAAKLGDGTVTSLRYADVLSGLATSRWGMAALARLALATLLIPLVFLAGRSRIAGEIALGLGVLHLVTFSLSGHAAATINPLLPILADWLHLCSGAVWLGGVVGLAQVALTTRRTAERTPLVAGLVARFSPLALGSVSLVVLTGIVRALNQIPRWPDLWNTAYGRMLLIKLGVLGGALLLGAFHWRRLGPRMRLAIANGDHTSARRFSRTIGLESLLAIGVVLVASALTQTPHPVQASASAGSGGDAVATLPTATPRIATPLSLAATKADLMMTLDLDDTRPGLRTFTATISDTTGLITPDRVRLRFEAQDLETGQQITILASQNGMYRGTSGALSLLGRWKIELQVRRANLPDVTVEWIVEMTR